MRYIRREPSNKEIAEGLENRGTEPSLTSGGSIALLLVKGIAAAAAAFVCAVAAACAW